MIRWRFCIGWAVILFLAVYFGGCSIYGVVMGVESTLENDNFNDNSIDTGFWEVITSETGATVTEQNEQLECQPGTPTGDAGLITKVSHDLTYCDISVVANNDDANSQELVLSLTKITDDDPWGAANAYRIMKYNHGVPKSIHVQRKVDSSSTTIYTAEWSGASGLIRVVISGGDITFYEGGEELVSEEYALGSYDCYVAISTHAYTETGMDVFDDFLASNGDAPVLEPPSDMVFRDLGGNTLNVTWNRADGANSTMIRVMRERYPASVTDGELVYFGENETVEDEGYSFDFIEYHFRAWSWEDGVGFSEGSVDSVLGGEAMYLIGGGIGLILLLLVAGFFKSGWLFLVLGLVSVGGLVYMGDVELVGSFWINAGLALLAVYGFVRGLVNLWR